MNRMMMASVVGGLTIFGGADLAHAGGVDKQWVDQDSQWFVHLDFEGMVRSQLGQELLRATGHDPESRMSFNELMQVLKDGPTDDEIGMALIHEIRDITVMGTDDDEPDLIVARVSPIVNGVLEAVEHEENLEIIKRDGHSIISFSDDSGDPEGHAIIIPTELRDTYRVVIGEQIDDVVGAIAAAQVRRTSPAWLDGADGKLLFVHVENPAVLADHDLPAMLHDTSGVELSFAEAGGMLDASLLIDTGDDQAAQDLVAMAQGMMAMARFAASDEPEIKQFLPLMNAINVSSSNGAVLATFNFEVSRLVEMMQPVFDDMNDDKDIDIHIEVNED